MKRERELLGVVGRVGERERERGEGPSPGRREPASLRHEQARGTSSEAVVLWDDTKGKSQLPFSVSFIGFLCKCLWEAPVSYNRTV